MHWIIYLITVKFFLPLLCVEEEFIKKWDGFI